MAEGGEDLRRRHRRQRFAVDDNAVVVKNHELPWGAEHPADATSARSCELRPGSLPCELVPELRPGTLALRATPCDLRPDRGQAGDGPGPYTSGMGTEDELKRCGQAAAALMGVAAARAKQVAEQLLGSRESAKEDAKQRAESLVDEGRRAAADVISALRKEASVLFRDLDHLEEHLRGGTGSLRPLLAAAPQRRRQ